MYNIDKLDFERGGITLYFFASEERNTPPLKRKMYKTKDELVEDLHNTPYHTKLILECSTKGDTRFSAFGARVRVFGLEDLIEFHYFLSKQFNNIKAPSYKDSWTVKMKYLRDTKGKTPDHIRIAGHKFSLDSMSQWYYFLWLKYLSENPDLVQYLSLFDDYNDIFGKPDRLCQADAIRMYMHHGYDHMTLYCRPLLQELKQRFTDHL